MLPSLVISLYTEKQEKQSRKLLNDALKEGYAEVIIALLVILGQPGVGKTHTKYLLLDRRPPGLRSSTICAEMPVRVEIRTVSGSRISNIGGQWKDVNDEQMLDIIAKMILLLEPEVSQKSDKGLLSKVANMLQLDIRGSTGAKSSKFDPASKSNMKMKAKEASTAASESLSDNCQKAMDEIMQKLLERITKLRSSVGREEISTDSLSNLVLKSKWVYVTDSGGQPEYHEILPLFVRCISSALCVTCLTDKLDEIKKVEYFQQGKKVGDSQYSQLSSKDTIECLFNTVRSASDQDKPPKVMVAGTHRDMLEKAIKQFRSSDSQSVAGGGVETLADKNRQLLDILTPEFADQLVYYSSDMKEVIFPLNALNPDEKDKAIAQSIRSHIQASGAKEVKIPIWWYIFELLLQELAKKLGRGVLTRAECLGMARLLGIKEDSFDAALVYFDELNVIKYTPSVLPNVIFVDSQIPLEKISELIHHRYHLCQPQTADGSLPVDGDWRHFRDRGIVSKDCLKHFEKHYVPGIFSVDDLCKLLKSRLVFAPIPNPSLSHEPVPSPDEKNETHFVMPSLQQTIFESQLSDYRDSSPDVATLLVRFPNRCRRAGIFGCFVVHLIRHCGWKLLLDQERPLYRNCLQLGLPTTPPCNVTLIDSNSYIEVIIKITDGTPSKECADLLNVTRDAVLAGIRAACKALSYKTTQPQFTFYCPHTDSLSSPSDKEHHTATLNAKKTHLICDVTNNQSYRLQAEHLVWFGISQGNL